MGNRAKVWNIGAEGQYLVGALAGAGIAYLTKSLEAWWIMPLMIAAGVAGGAAWAAIPAFLKTRYRVNEILIEPDARLCRAAASQLSRHGPVERSERP